MQEFHWNEREALFRSGRPGMDVRERLLGFMARDLCTYRLDKSAGGNPGGQIHARSRSVEGFTLSRIATTEARSRVVRDDTEIAGDGRNQFALISVLRGEVRLLQFGRSLDCTPQTFALAAWSEPIAHEALKGPADTICFAIPRAFVEQRVMVGEDLCVRPYEPAKGLHRLAFQTVSTFEANAWTLSDGEFEKSARAVADLVLLALGDSGDAAASEHSVRAAHLARAKRLLRERLSDSDLRLERIAQELGLSLSYLHKVFRDEGRTMYEYLKTVRLQRARELLELSASRKMTITEVALECGFSGMSHFSRCFKEAFGLSPQDVLRNH
jgi:AraC-like DNA-binding protein